MVWTLPHCAGNGELSHMTDPNSPDLTTDDVPTAAEREDSMTDPRPAMADATGGADPLAGGDPSADVASDAAGDALVAVQRELADQKDKYLRLYAEFENFRRRAVRDRQDAEKMGMGAVMKGLLETLDDLGRVAHMTPEGTETQKVLEGIELVEKKLLKSLAGHGLEVVNPVNATFDPAVHEAITTTPALSAEDDNVVATVYQVGYVLNGTLLRPARVVVRQWNG